MGDPKLPKRKFKTPTHPWQGARIQEEGELIREYGLRRKREIWKAEAYLRKWRTQAKNITAMPEEKRDAAKLILITKLNKMGILSEKAELDDVLTLSLRDILERRLQTQLYKKGMAYTPKQARQFIVHKKVTVNGVKVDSPSYLVLATDDLGFARGFSFVKPTKKDELEQKMQDIEAQKLSEEEKAKQEEKKKQEEAIAAAEEVAATVEAKPAVAKKEVKANA